MHWRYCMQSCTKPSIWLLTRQNCNTGIFFSVLAPSTFNRRIYFFFSNFQFSFEVWFVCVLHIYCYVAMVTHISSVFWNKILWEEHHLFLVYSYGFIFSIVSISSEFNESIEMCSSRSNQDLNSLRPRDSIWRWRTGSTLAQVMACCLTAPSHHLNQCWLIISKVLRRSCENNFTRDTSAINHQN